MKGIYQVYTICHIPVIYLVYTCHMKCHSIPGIYLVYTFPMKLCAPPGCKIAIEMRQYTGIGLQGCLMFCRMWQRHWSSVSQGKRYSFPAQENANHSNCFSVSNNILGILSILSRYVQEKSFPSEKPNMRYQMQRTRVREGTPGIRETIPS